MINFLPKESNQIIRHKASKSICYTLSNCLVWRRERKSKIPSRNDVLWILKRHYPLKFCFLIIIANSHRYMYVENDCKYNDTRKKWDPLSLLLLLLFLLLFLWLILLLCCFSLAIVWYLLKHISTAYVLIVYSFTALQSLIHPHLFLQSSICMYACQ